MKKLFLSVMLTLFIFSGFAFGGITNLLGEWEYVQNCVRIGPYEGFGFPDNPPAYPPGYSSTPGNPQGYTFSPSESEVLIIEVQQGNLFWGHVFNGEEPNQFFYGAIVGKKVYFTFWDGFANGEVRGNGKEIEFVSQNPIFNPPNGPGICVGTAIKISE